MAGGRPTKYDAEEVAKSVVEYITECNENNYLPSIEGLAVKLKVWRSTLHDWADPKSDVYHPEFHDIFEQLKARQAMQLIQNGLVNNYNSTITKLILTKHGYVDRQDVTSDSKPVQVAGFNYVTPDEVSNNTENSGH